MKLSIDMAQGNPIFFCINGHEWTHIREMKSPYDSSKYSNVVPIDKIRFKQTKIVKDEFKSGVEKL